MINVETQCSAVCQHVYLAWSGGNMRVFILMICNLKIYPGCARVHDVVQAF